MRTWPYWESSKAFWVIRTHWLVWLLGTQSQGVDFAPSKADELVPPLSLLFLTLNAWVFVSFEKRSVWCGPHWLCKKQWPVVGSDTPFSLAEWPGFSPAPLRFDLSLRGSHLGISVFLVSSSLSGWSGSFLNYESVAGLSSGADPSRLCVEDHLLQKASCQSASAVLTAVLDMLYLSFLSCGLPSSMSLLFGLWWLPFFCVCFFFLPIVHLRSDSGLGLLTSHKMAASCCPCYMPWGDNKSYWSLLGLLVC